jgi:hypothetical protein
VSREETRKISNTQAIKGAVCAVIVKGEQLRKRKRNERTRAAFSIRSL